MNTYPIVAEPAPGFERHGLWCKKFFVIIGTLKSLKMGSKKSKFEKSAQAPDNRAQLRAAPAPKHCLFQLLCFNRFIPADPGVDGEKYQLPRYRVKSLG